MPTVFCHDCFLSNPTGGFGPLLTPHRPQTRALSSCLFPAWITHLPTPRGCGQPCGFVSYPRSKLTPSVCKTRCVSHTPVGPIRGAFFFKNSHCKTAEQPPPFWSADSRGPCARAHRGRSPGGPGGRSHHAEERPRRGPEAGGEASREAATPFSSAPQRGPYMNI